MDELGALERELAPLKFKIARLDVLRKAIREHYAADPGDQAFLAVGSKFDVSVGMKSREGTIYMAGLLKLVGLKLFVRIVSATKKSLEAHLTAPVIADLTSYELTGFRTLKVFEKGTTA